MVEEILSFKLMPQGAAPSIGRTEERNRFYYSEVRNILANLDSRASALLSRPKEVFMNQYATGIHRLHVIACSLNQVPGDFQHNQTNILSAINRAKNSGANVLVCPELCIPGYGLEDRVLDPEIATICAEILFDQVLEQTKGLLLVVGLPVIVRRALYNGAAVCFDGKLLGITLKQQLAQDGPFYEARQYKAWDGGFDTWSFRNSQYPVGELLYNIHGCIFGCEICQDAWVTERTGLQLVQAGAHVIFNPSCSPYQPGKRSTRGRLIVDFTRLGSCAYVYASQSGISNGTVPCDPYAVVASNGEILAGPPDSYFGESVDVHAYVDLVALSCAALSDASLHPRQSVIKEVQVLLPDCHPWLSTAITEPPTQCATRWRMNNSEEVVDLIERFNMLAMSMFWYLVRTKQQGWLLPLSGGRDSALVLAALSRGLDLAHAELGWAGLLDALRHLSDLAELAVNDMHALKRRLVRTCYIVGQASQESTAEAAAALALELWSEHLVLDSRPAFEAAVSTMRPTRAHALSWGNEQDVVPLENLTTTVRFALARCMANAESRIMVCTGNLTEMALGYYTLGADVNGGYAPLTSINKSTVIALLGLLSVGWTGMPSIAAISKVLNAGPATAELQPGGGQTDEGFMGPFPVIDMAIDLLLGRHWPVAMVFAELRRKFPQCVPWDLLQWLDRLCCRWSTSQWKRYQATPGPRLSSFDLMSQVSTRSPIIGGGFELQMQRLKKDLEIELGPCTCA